jgi:bifunctional non-homologous end joining protein LigD
MADRLDEYRRKRDAARTPEPVPKAPPARGRNDTFVIQQHHARRLHWDLRLERDGVLVSWAVPRGIPRDPGRNHLAVHTEDHPLEYLEFHGDIPAGEYGGGRMTIYDRGTYETEKWRDDEVIVVLHGERARGRYVLFQTAGKDWMIHRMDPPEPGWTPMPELVRPMRATPTEELPEPDDAWAYEPAWDGLRAVAHVSGGRLRLVSHDRDVTSGYPELRPLAEELAPVECVLDGMVVAFDESGRISRTALRSRTGVTDATAVRRQANRVPVHYLVFDLLWLDGQSTVDMPYTARRELLDSLGLAGSHWQVPPYYPAGGAEALATSRSMGLPGVVAKRPDAPYRPGERSADWLAVTPAPEYQRVVIVGWQPGNRPDTVGALLLAEPDDAGRLRYAGRVTAGLAGEDGLRARLRRLQRRTPPVDGVPQAQAEGVTWVSPKLAAEVAADGRTRDGRLRRPRWRGLR